MFPRSRGETVFHRFSSQTERREYGGSGFLEMQFCRLPRETKLAEIVNRIENWKDDSLYIDDEDKFYREYGDIFDSGFYSNLERGTVDVYGINYYPPEYVGMLLARIAVRKPAGYESVLGWLRDAEKYNGFYILGI